MIEHSSSDDPRVLFGNQLRSARKAKGLSQESLAALSGLDRTYVASCERGKRNVGIVNIYRIASALGISPAELIVLPTKPDAVDP